MGIDGERALGIGIRLIILTVPVADEGEYTKSIDLSRVDRECVFGRELCAIAGRSLPSTLDIMQIVQSGQLGVRRAHPRIECYCIVQGPNRRIKISLVAAVVETHCQAFAADIGVERPWTLCRRGIEDLLFTGAQS